MCIDFNVYLLQNIVPKLTVLKKYTMPNNSAQSTYQLCILTSMSIDFSTQYPNKQWPK